MEMRMLIAKLVWNFDMAPVSGADQHIEWENDARFEGFWNLPAPFVQFKLKAPKDGRR